MPVTPPIVYRKMKPTANSIGVSKVSEPPHIVAIQEKILMPVGTAMTIVEKLKKARESTLIPVVNMWCAQTMKLMKPIATSA
jgi:trans-2-enoyl-CoA reductase